MSTKRSFSTPYAPADPTEADYQVEVTGETALDIVETTSRKLASTNGQTTPAAAPGGVSTNLISELNNIDFRNMIGGPLQAAVDAQVKSSLATVDFIQKVGFKYPTTTDADGNVVPDKSQTPELMMADFTHTRKGRDENGQEIDDLVSLKVPLLAMLPIPALRIEHVIIDFNVKLNSVETASVSDKLAIGAEVGGGWGPVNFKVTASYQRQSTTGVEVKKEYSLQVQVKAVQDEMPAGLERVLGILAA